MLKPCYQREDDFLMLFQRRIREETPSQLAGRDWPRDDFRRVPWFGWIDGLPSYEELGFSLVSYIYIYDIYIIIYIYIWWEHTQNSLGKWAIFVSFIIYNDDNNNNNNNNNIIIIIIALINISSHSATQPLWVTEWLSGCSSDCGRVAEWLLQPLWQSGWVAAPATLAATVAEWLSGWVAASATLAEWLSGCSSHSGRVAEWLLLQPLWQSDWLSGCSSSHSGSDCGRMAGWLSGCQSGWVAVPATLAEWLSVWVAAPATLAEWLSGCVSH